MTREESIIFVGTLKTVIKDIPKYNGAGIEEAMDMAIKALEQESCEDCISRQDAIKYLCTNMNWYNEDGETADDEEKLNAITDLVNGVPSVTLQPKTGHWRHYEGVLICSECGAEFYDDIMEYCGDDVPKFCLDCGCHMIEPQESEEEKNE